MSFQLPVIPFDVSKVSLGYPIVTVGGDVVTDFHYFVSHPTEHNCIGVVCGRLLLYSNLGLRPRKYYNSPGALDLRMLDIAAQPNPKHDLLIKSYEKSI